MSIHEDILDKQVGAATVIEVAAQVAFKLGVDDVARLLTIVELACVLTNRRALPFSTDAMLVDLMAIPWVDLRAKPRVDLTATWRFTGPDMFFLSSKSSPSEPDEMVWISSLSTAVAEV